VKDDIGKHPTHFRFVRNYGEYQAARREGLTAAFIGIQGGQAFQANQASLDAIPEDVHRITLVHLTNSRIGTTSSPLGPDRGGLPQRGRELVEVMNAKRILVDLAHINRAGFMDAADVHDRSQPLICTHTGVSGVHDHWRNIDDEQIRRVTDTGGVIGVIFHSMFLAPVLHGLARCPMEAILLHMEHVIHIAGEHAVSIGTDYDGMIVPPLPLQQVTDLPRLVQGMLDRKWPETRIRGALGLNALRVFQEIRP
jgi:membrane dipeptidase